MKGAAAVSQDALVKACRTRAIARIEIDACLEVNIKETHVALSLVHRAAKHIQAW